MPMFTLVVSDELAAQVEKLVRRGRSAPVWPFSGAVEPKKLRGDEKKKYDEFKQQSAEYQKRPYANRSEVVRVALERLLATETSKTKEVIQEPGR